MTMRKYLVTVHEDGRISCVEYEDPETVLVKERNELFKVGYMAALVESKKKVLEFRRRREDSREDKLMYAAVASVHDEVAARMASYIGQCSTGPRGIAIELGASW